MIRDIIFNFLDYIEERFNFVSKDLQLVMCSSTYLEFCKEVDHNYSVPLGYIETYYGMSVRQDEEALPGFLYIIKDKIVLGIIKIK